MTKLEYIWIDGTEKAPQLRSKTKVLESYEWDGSVSKCPVEAIYEEDSVPSAWDKFITFNYKFFGQERP